MRHFLGKRVHYKVKVRKERDMFSGVFVDAIRTGICVSYDIETLKVISDTDYSSRQPVHCSLVEKYEVIELAELLTHDNREVRRMGIFLSEHQL